MGSSYTALQIRSVSYTIFFINSFFYAIFVINFVRRGVDDKNCLLVKTKIVHHLE